jgi:hypothetical protein
MRVNFNEKQSMERRERGVRMRQKESQKDEMKKVQ